AEWPDDQRLAYEKEVLGFYISGHPLAQYGAVIESLGVTTSADLATRSHGARVTLLGHVAALKETATKSGSRMAFVTLEDMAGAVEVTVFPEPFKAAAPFLRSREPLVVRGRVDDGDKGRVILAEDVRLLEQALGGTARPRVARHPKRPQTRDWCKLLLEEFTELHGDRLFRDDPAIIGGLARFDGQSVVVIGHQKGRDTREKIARNFGMPHPEGYRKALRLMELAAKFGKPILTFIDTPGAYPGLGAEERGQAEAIARNLRRMASLPTPIVA